MTAHDAEETLLDSIRDLAVVAVNLYAEAPNEASRDRAVEYLARSLAAIEQVTKVIEAKRFLRFVEEASNGSEVMQQLRDGLDMRVKALAVAVDANLKWLQSAATSDVEAVADRG